MCAFASQKGAVHNLDQGDDFEHGALIHRGIGEQGAQVPTRHGKLALKALAEHGAPFCAPEHGALAPNAPQLANYMPDELPEAFVPIVSKDMASSSTALVPLSRISAELRPDALSGENFFPKRVRTPGGTPPPNCIGGVLQHVPHLRAPWDPQFCPPWWAEGHQ